MSSLERFTKLKKRIATLQRDSDRARGALEGVERQLEEEFGCASLEQAKAMLVKEEDAEEASREKFETALEQFETKHAEFLE